MEKFHQVSSCNRIIEIRLGTFSTGYICKGCLNWFSWRPDKKALIAKRKGFRRIPVKKIPGVVALLKPPLYCRGCKKD